MRLRLGIVLTSLAAVLAGAAQAGSEASSAPVGDPHAFFPLSTASTLDRIAQGCARRGEPVRGRHDDVVICEVVMGLPERIAARVMLREPFARSPRALLRFTAAPSGERSTRVDVTGSVEYGRAAPHTRVQSLAGARFAQHRQAVLEDFGGKPQPF